MSEQIEITGEWIKQQCDFAYKNFEEKNKNNHNTFILNPDAVELNKTIATLRKQCPHEYNNGYCIYCKLKET